MNIKEVILGLLLLFVLSSLGCASHARRTEVVAVPPVQAEKIEFTAAELAEIKATPTLLDNYLATEKAKPADPVLTMKVSEFKEAMDKSYALGQMESYQQGKQDMYRAAAAYLSKECMIAGCGIQMPSYILLDVLTEK